MLQVCTLTILLSKTTSADYLNEIIPSCTPDKKICEFSWVISKKETLVWYNNTLGDKGYPLVVRNDSYFLRQPDGCMDLEPLKDERK